MPRLSPRIRCLGPILPVLTLLALLAAPAAAGTNPVTRAMLEAMGIPVTTGAAEGYVPDAVCATCHKDIAASFAETGMGRSFYRADPVVAIEDFGAPDFLHAPTGRYYRVFIADGRYRFTRYRLASDGTKIDEFATDIDWIMGSGNHSRVYMYQTADGALFQLPLAWYSQTTSWAMAPGFETDVHQGISRMVQARCMGCHNAYPEVPEGSDRAGHDTLYPTDLPEGIGCQRCHGPGADHSGLALSGLAEGAALKAAIVNPGDLEPDLLYSVCYGCHMQPTVSINGQLRLGRGHFGFRPGQPIGAFIAQMEIEDALRIKADRFDINHHPYRLEQSTCFTESDGALGCLTCHDPHVKRRPEERASHYRAACLSCHETDADGLPRLAGSTVVHPAITPEDDCTSCHMPERRTQDVTEVWMTDHRITRFPPPGDLLARIAKRQAEVLAVSVFDPSEDLGATEELMLKLSAINDYNGGKADYATDALLDLLQHEPQVSYEPWLVALDGLANQRRWAEAVPIAEQALRRGPDVPEIVNTAALAFYLTGDKPRGLSMLRDLVTRDPLLVDARYNLARLILAEGDAATARTEVEEVIRLRHNHWRAW
jgi:hypothetical protein